METTDLLVDLLDNIKLYENNPNELSQLAVMLAGTLYSMSEELAKTQTEYAQAVIKELEKSTKDKKISVAEAERRADIVTQCKHDQKRNEYNSLLEIINTIKVRIRTLQGEKGLGNIT